LIINVLLFGIVPPGKTLYCIILYRYEYVTYFVKVDVKLLNMTAKGTNEFCTGHTVEHIGFLLLKVAHARYNAALHLLQTENS
jgi:hypothetical protein